MGKWIILNITEWNGIFFKLWGFLLEVELPQIMATIKSWQESTIFVVVIQFGWGFENLLPYFLQKQLTTLNSPRSEYRQTIQIIRSAELTVLFNIGNQWSVSREIVRIQCRAELSRWRIKRSQLYGTQEFCMRPWSPSLELQSAKQHCYMTFFGQMIH